MSHWSERTKALVLCALVLLIYGFGIGREFVFDDPLYISENPLLHQSDAFRVFWFSSKAFNYYPLFWSLLRCQWLLWADQPLGYHLVSLLLHCANALLVWRIAYAWRIRGAWWIAALFAVHPLNVQTVAWAAEQKNTWSFFFMALAILAFVRHARRRGCPTYFAALVCFLAALACKTSVVCVPLFLAIVYCFRGNKISRAFLWRLLPFFIASLAAGLTTIWFEQNRVGAKSLIGALSFWQRTEAAGAAFWFYFEKALVPIHLTPIYRGWSDSDAAAHTAIPALLLVALLAVCAFGWRRIGAPIALGITYYALMLLPLLGIFDTNYFAYSQIADHWQYHALPGLLVAVVAAVQALMQRWPRLAAWRNTGGAAVVLGLALLASAHFAHFEDARTLWSYVIERNPEAWIAWYNLGNEQAARRDYPAAIANYRESIRIKPDYYRAHFNLANTLAAANRLHDADQAFLESQEMQPSDPDGYVNRAVVLLRLDREDEAAAELNHALRLDPGKASAAIDLIAICLRRGRIEDARFRLPPVAAQTEWAPAFSSPPLPPDARPLRSLRSDGSRDSTR